MKIIRINGIKITVDTLHGDQQPFECDQCGTIIDYGDKVYCQEKDSVYLCSIKCVKGFQKTFNLEIQQLNKTNFQEQWNANNLID